MTLTKIRLSHSTQELLNSCERLFQIERLLKGERITNNQPVFSRGHAFGKGVQVYLLTQDIDKAIYQAWLAYWPELESGETPAKVSLHRTLHALLCAQKAMDELLSLYTIVSFHNQPAVELGIKLIIDETFYYVGFIDVVMRNKQTGLYCVLEVKYTGSWHEIDGMFLNSGQGTGYSISLDKIVGEDQAHYGVVYFVCQDKNKEPKEIEFHIREYKKGLKDRLNWFVTLGLDVERIKTMRKIGVFPQRAKNCIAYNRTCRLLGTCGLSVGDTENNDEPDPYDAEGRYSFVYNLDEIIQSHLERI